MDQIRPVNLNLFTIKFPIAAIASILHRISGVVLFLFIPFALWVLYHALHSETDFIFLTLTLKKPLFRCLVWVGLTTLTYHLLAGLRHLLADLHKGTSKTGGAQTAWAVIFLTLMVSLGIGYGLC